MAVPKRKMSKARRDQRRRCLIMYARNVATMMAKRLSRPLSKQKRISRTVRSCLFFCPHGAYRKNLHF